MEDQLFHSTLSLGLIQLHIIFTQNFLHSGHPCVMIRTVQSTNENIILVHGHAFHITEYIQHPTLKNFACRRNSKGHALKAKSAHRRNEHCQKPALVVQRQLVICICCIELAEYGTVFQFCSNVIKCGQNIFLSLNGSVEASKINTYAYIITVAFRSYYYRRAPVCRLRCWHYHISL